MAARLPAGPVRTGDLYVLESWLDEVALIEVAPGALPWEHRGRLPEELGRRALVRIATSGHAAGSEPFLARGRRLAANPPLSVRDALISHARAHGFG